jgi:hypothetical protein
MLLTVLCRRDRDRSEHRVGVEVRDRATAEVVGVFHAVESHPDRRACLVFDLDLAARG